MRKLGVLLSLVWILVACAGSAPALRGTVLDPPRPVQDFTLINQHGRPFRLSDQRGRVLLLFFGYTHCPDVCPTTLSTWARIHEALGDDAAQVRFVFITVDPERDTPERLREHVRIFNADFAGLTGASDALRPVYQTFGVYFEKDTTTASAASYLVSHTASTFAVDRDRQWRLRYAFDTPIEDIVHDLKQLLN
jgi:protein SCO1/2